MSLKCTSLKDERERESEREREREREREGYFRVRLVQFGSIEFNLESFGTLCKILDVNVQFVVSTAVIKRIIKVNESFVLPRAPPPQNKRGGNKFS